MYRLPLIKFALLLQYCTPYATLQLLCKFAIWDRFGEALHKRCRLARMLHAVLYALLDSVNALLIGILVAIGIMLPRGMYRKIATLVVVGDWLGVLAATALVFSIFLGIKDQIISVLDSPIAGIVLIVVGVLLALGAWRSKGESNPLVEKLLGPLRTPSLLTGLVGFAMGIIQSLTSVPFYYGLMHLAAGDLSVSSRVSAGLLYACLALSLPTLCGLGIAMVRHYPDSPAGRIFAAARRNSTQVALYSGYAVAVFLIIMGVVSL